MKILRDPWKIFNSRYNSYLEFLSDEIYCKHTFILPMILTYPFSSIVAMSLQITIPNKIQINISCSMYSVWSILTHQMYTKSLQARTFLSFLHNISWRTYPEWNQPLGSMQASVFALSSQYPSMTLYPRKQISPVVLMGTTRPWSSTIFALKIQSVDWNMNNVYLKCFKFDPYWLTRIPLVGSLFQSLCRVLSKPTG